MNAEMFQYDGSNVWKLGIYVNFMKSERVDMFDKLIDYARSNLTQKKYG